MRSPKVISMGLSTSPSILIFQALASAGASGTRPLLRMKNLSIGVTSSSVISAGVSAFSGLSPSTMSLALPSISRSFGPFAAAGAVPCAKAMPAGSSDTPATAMPAPFRTFRRDAFRGSD